VISGLFCHCFSHVNALIRRLGLFRHSCEQRIAGISLARTQPVRDPPGLRAKDSKLSFNKSSHHRFLSDLDHVQLADPYISVVAACDTRVPFPRKLQSFLGAK